ncbi:mevalonate kinase family protein [Coxiella endosymbiont of Amblyomma americanum]|uniref:mevalonate kinase family protein n=1 Tax=Coxiella endosymbiont of Amblyomma americanum TaxID=325775 RepID=UPI000A46568E|nr:mevalonate kinase [Coxiella endosymbiont of Amblyomma americanum]
MYRAKASGSLILLGEYAVLHGKTALVAAINKSIFVALKPRNDDRIFIDSDLGTLHISRHQIFAQAPFEFILEALNFVKPLSGCNIEVTSDLPSSFGLGSSAAITVALLIVLNRWHKKSLTKIDLWKAALQVIHRVQGVGSGADCAASIFGGVIAFNNSPFSVISLKEKPPLVAIYSGNKLSTARAINIINKKRQQCLIDYKKIEEKMHALSIKAINIINTRNWIALGNLFNSGQELMTAMGVSNIFLENLIYALRKQPNILGAKISGSGFGDCIIGVGKFLPTYFPRNKEERKLGVKQIPLSIISKGAEFDEIQ